MKQFLIFLIAICIMSIMMPGVLGASSDGTNEQLIVTDRPSDYGQMVNVAELSQGIASQMPSNAYNALWVVDETGEMNDSLTLPAGSYARVFITPSQSGNIAIEQLSPELTQQTSDMGTVEKLNTYRIWFYGSETGTYQMRYSVNGGEYSNIVEFYVS